MKIIKGFLVFLGIIAMLLIFLISAFELVVYRGDRYFEKKYVKYGVLEDVDMKMDDLLYVSQEMMDYLRGDREDLSVITTIGQEERDFFNQREKDHMADVQALFLAGLMIRRIALAVFMITLFLLWFIKQKEEKLLRFLAKGYLIVTGIVILISGIIVAFMARDFSKAFTIFHEIFFTNDLWILDPKTDLLINVLPEGFFIDTGIEVLTVFAGMLLAGTVLSLGYLKINKRKIEIR